MKAIAIARFGGPEVLKLIEVPEPVPAAGEALVALEYAGVNFIDVYMRSGHYARSHTYRSGIRDPSRPNRVDPAPRSSSRR